VLFKPKIKFSSCKLAFFSTTNILFPVFKLLGGRSSHGSSLSGFRGLHLRQQSGLASPPQAPKSHGRHADDVDSSRQSLERRIVDVAGFSTVVFVDGCPFKFARFAEVLIP
jgi:hypothetical protein